MSVLVVGLSHSSAPMATLERAVLSGDALAKLLHDVSDAGDVGGSMVLSTCNRIEIYADVQAFHAGVAAVCELLARHSGVPLAELTPHLYVHYADSAAAHLLAVSCGLESMVIGESQILGQVRQAVALAGEQGTLSRPLADLGVLALRAGKRARAETGIDGAGRGLVGAGLAAAARRLGRPDLAGVPVLVVGAGAMSSVAAASAARMGAAPLVVANRTAVHAQRLASAVGGIPAELSGLEARIAAADLVISCTGASGQVITTAAVRAALAARGRPGDPVVFLDLALPRDVEPGAGRLPGSIVIGLEDLAVAAGPGEGGGMPHEADIAAVRQIVAEELAARRSADRAALVAPTVVALRAKAARVVEAETARLDGRLAGLDARSRLEIAQSMRRIADKLLHAPTVRVKELAGSPGADTYEAALRVLFDLDPGAVQAVITPDARLAGWPGAEDET